MDWTEESDRKSEDGADMDEDDEGHYQDVKDVVKSWGYNMEEYISAMQIPPGERSIDEKSMIKAIQLSANDPLTAVRLSKLGVQHIGGNFDDYEYDFGLRAMEAVFEEQRRLEYIEGMRKSVHPDGHPKADEDEEHGTDAEAQYLYGRRLMNAPYIPRKEVLRKHDYAAAIQPVLETMFLLAKYGKIPMSYDKIANEAFRISGSKELYHYHERRKDRFLQGKDDNFLPVMTTLAKVNGYIIINRFLRSKKVLLDEDYADMMELFSFNPIIRDSFLACLKGMKINPNNRNAEALVLMVGIAKMSANDIIVNADVESFRHLYMLMKKFDLSHQEHIKKTGYHRSFGKWLLIAEWIAEALVITRGNGFTHWFKENNTFQWWINGAINF